MIISRGKMWELTLFVLLAVDKLDLNFVHCEILVTSQGDIVVEEPVCKGKKTEVSGLLLCRFN